VAIIVKRRNKNKEGKKRKKSRRGKREKRHGSNYDRKLIAGVCSYFFMLSQSQHQKPEHFETTQTVYRQDKNKKIEKHGKRKKRSKSEDGKYGQTERRQAVILAGETPVAFFFCCP
jgi:hypothetical protein